MDDLEFCYFARDKIFRYCQSSRSDIPLKFVFERADLHAAMVDHHYSKKPFGEYWVDRSLMVSKLLPCNYDISAKFRVEIFQSCELVTKPHYSLAEAIKFFILCLVFTRGGHGNIKGYILAAAVPTVVF